MNNTTLALILAAGAGTRVSHLYTDDEPNKPMLKVGNRRLIEIILDYIQEIGIPCAVLTFPGEQYATLHNLVREHNIPLLFQKAKQRKLPTLLELPYILGWQYYFSKDSKFLQSFDHILTLPCDLVPKKRDLVNLVSLHVENNHPKLKRKITILSKPKEINERGELFLLDGTRIMGVQKYAEPLNRGWIATNQAGIYIFSKEFLKNPFPLLFGAKYVFGQMYLTTKEWLDYGNPDNILSLRALSRT